MSSPVRAGAGIDVGDQAVAHHQRALDDLVGKHDAGIGENGLGGHFRQSLISGSFSGRARPKRVMGMHDERGARLRLRQTASAPSTDTGRSSTCAKQAVDRRAHDEGFPVTRRGRTASCGSGRCRTRKGSPTGTGCGTPRRSMRSGLRRSISASVSGARKRSKASTTSSGKTVERRQRGFLDEREKAVDLADDEARNGDWHRSLRRSRRRAARSEASVSSGASRNGAFSVAWKP